MLPVLPMTQVCAMERTNDVLVENATNGRQCDASDWTAGLWRPDDLQEWVQVFQGRYD